MVFGDPEEIQAYRDVIAEYKNQQPDVNVKLIEASDRDDLIARLGTSFSGGTPPDLFLLNYRFYGQFAARDVLEPIESRVDDSKVFEQEDFYEQAMNAFRFNGTLTCLPQNISSLVVYYNKDLFKAAGVAEPKEGWTWNDMVAAAKKLKKRRRRGHRRGGIADPRCPVRLVERRRDRRQRRQADALHARHARGAEGDDRVLQPARGSRRRAG